MRYALRRCGCRGRNQDAALVNLCVDVICSVPDVNSAIENKNSKARGDIDIVDSVGMLRFEKFKILCGVRRAFQSTTFGFTLMLVLPFSWRKCHDSGSRHDTWQRSVSFH